MKVLKMIPEKCTGCMRCELACSYEQTGTFRPSKSVIRVSAFENHTSYAPYTCPQCDEAWCMTACPIEAISISSPGAKEVNNNLCVGCKLCTIACPYGTIFLILKLTRLLSVICVVETQLAKRFVLLELLNT